jgi:ATP-binding cassette, subfamily F, member 3
MIRFENVCKSYGEQDLFTDLSFTINPDDKCGFVGRNGTGKTTLFKLILEKEALNSGSIQTPNDYTFGYLDQHITFSKKTIIEEATHDMKCEEWERDYKAETVLFGLGFTKEDMQKNPKDLSGGFQLRIQLAKVLFSESSCLLLDEPTNYLDIVSIRWLKRFLKTWKGSFIIISHDREFLDSVTNHTIGLHRKKMYKVRGGTETLFDLILNEEESYLATRKNIEKKRAHLEGFITRFGAKATKATQAKSKQKALDKIAPLEQLMKLHSLQFSFNEKPFPGRKILSAQNVCFSYDKKKGQESDTDLIKDLSIDVVKGNKIAIVGKNGYGKSTILKLLCNELKPRKGDVEVSENASIGYFGQTNIDRLDPSNTIIDEISLSNPLLNIGEVRKICGIMLFAKDEAKKKISVLSGGEKSRVLLGKILAKPCNVLLLDEPTNHLDMESIESLLESLEKFVGALVIVTHSEMILNRLDLNKLVVCHENQQNFYSGNYEEFMEKFGWNEDSLGENEKDQLKSLKNKQNKNSVLDKKALKELRKEIKKNENKIATLERSLKKDRESLDLATINGDINEVETFAKSIEDRQKKIDFIFSKLEELSKDLEC